ncbi:MAG: SpaH/EbpB family LPXTG-anchored major pilin [Oscillospiraceae bacterium]|nr:SpaH/EbpB family LPXTG-anchored major pilin [Oscillospiraceae bacterium]
MKLTKIASLVLAIIMVFSLGITAFAEETGSITINNASTGNTYEIYKLLDLESYNSTTKVYSYKVNTEWEDFFETDDAKAYFTVDGQGYATWTNASEDETTAAAFAKIALAYAEEKGINPVKSTKNDGEYEVEGSTIKFSDLELGYYLIDSTMGALCGLTTTNPNASINAKNRAPIITKQVLEDSTNQWGIDNTADIGQKIEFRITIDVQPGAQNYVLHDGMAEGLSFLEFKGVEHISGGTAHTEAAESYSVVTDGLEDGCTFEVRFTEKFCNGLKANDKIIVSYYAKLNSKAVINGDGNINTAKLTFGDPNEEHKTELSSTVTKTFGIDIIKTDSQNTLLDGAEFKIYDAPKDGNEVKVVLMADGVTYRRAEEGEEGVSIVVKDGQVRVVGLDNGNYYLEETVSPKGYNKLSERKAFTISNGNLDAIFNSGVYSTGSGVHVVNKSGTMLPETGGIGTTMFYVLGGVLVAGSLVFLVTKKRMGNH